MTDSHLELPLLPTRNQIVLPHASATVEVVRPESLAMLESLDLDAKPEILIAAQRDYAVEHPGQSDINPIGVRARIEKYTKHEGLGYVIEVSTGEKLRIVGVDAATGLIAKCVHALSDSGSPFEFGAEATFEEQLEWMNATDSATERSTSERLQVRIEAERQRIQALRPPTGADLAQLWVLEEGAEERICADLAGGTISEQEADWLRQFRDKGYVVWEKLIKPDLIDAFIADVRSIRNYPGCFVSTDHGRTRSFRFTDSKFGSFESVFDLYVNFESARRVCFHPRITRFLTLLFDTTPLAIQQLLFQRSNQHLLHQDTAYVCVKDALLMAATWIALEDVVPGRGELTYFEGSHKLPHKLFADGSKRFRAELDDAEATQAQLLESCAKHGYEKRDFIAKKGDVFVWAADLVHGSNPRTAPEHETRMSCVTHYCPATTEPLFFWLRPDMSHVQAYGENAAYASAYYRLPVEEGIARPTFLGAEPC